MEGVPKFGKHSGEHFLKSTPGLFVLFIRDAARWFVPPLVGKMNNFCRLRSRVSPRKFVGDRDKFMTPDSLPGRAQFARRLGLAAQNLR
jgi:hypothetical protein